MVDDVMEGAKVSIEYSPVPYNGKKSRGNNDDFPPGCTFKLYSITIQYWMSVALVKGENLIILRII